MTSEAEALKNRGNAQRAAGNLDEALACYRRALQADPDYGPALYNLGVVLQERGSFAEAEPCFARLRSLDPGDRDSIFRLGLVLAELARYAEAAQAFRDALALDPGNPLLWLRLAQAQRASGDAAQAKRSASQGLDIEPKLAEAHNLLRPEILAEITQKGSLRGVTDIPEPVRRLFVTSFDIEPEWHVRMQAAFQAYTDNGVSKTINFPESATKDDVAGAYHLAYDQGIVSRSTIAYYRYRTRRSLAADAEQVGAGLQRQSHGITDARGVDPGRRAVRVGFQNGRAAAVLAGVAGFLYSGLTNVASVTLADTALLPSVAAAVIGGSPFSRMSFSAETRNARAVGSRPRASARRTRSRSVTIPHTVPSLRVTSTSPMLASRMMVAASRTGAVSATVRGFLVITWSMVCTDTSWSRPATTRFGRCRNPSARAGRRGVPRG